MRIPAGSIIDPFVLTSLSAVCSDCNTTFVYILTSHSFRCKMISEVLSLNQFNQKTVFLSIGIRDVYFPGTHLGFAAPDVACGLRLLCLAPCNFAGDRP